MLRYLVMAKRKAQFQTSALEAHREFLDNLRQQGTLEMAGPFTDKTGGAYLLKASSYEEAQALAFSDPLHTTNSSEIVVYEWDAN